MICQQFLGILVPWDKFEIGFSGDKGTKPRAGYHLWFSHSPGSQHCGGGIVKEVHVGLGQAEQPVPASNQACQLSAVAVASFQQDTGVANCRFPLKPLLLCRWRRQNGKVLRKKKFQAGSVIQCEKQLMTARQEFMNNRG